MEFLPELDPQRSVAIAIARGPGSSARAVSRGPGLARAEAGPGEVVEVEQPEP